MLPDSIKNELEFLSESPLSKETNWLVVKKQIMLRIKSPDRKLFTRRDEKTKMHQLHNQLEQEVRVYWHTLTGNTLLMPIDKMLPDTTPDMYHKIETIPPRAESDDE